MKLNEEARALIGPGADATLVTLNPDGTFSMRFALPDGNMDLPIKALSKDETDSRQIEIKVTRATKNDGK